MEQDIAALARDILLESIEAQQDGWEEPHQRLSGTGSCLRQQWYGLTMPQQASRRSADGILEMREGDVHEADLRQLLQEAGFTVTRYKTEEERTVYVTLPSGLRVSGHIDGEISGHHLTPPYLYDSKALGVNRYKDFVKLGLREAAYSYWLQLQGYMLAEKQQGREWPGSFLIAWCKDGGAVRRYLPPGVHPKIHWELILPDPDGMDEVLTRHMRLEMARTTGIPPEREYSPTDKKEGWHCDPRYCGFRGICYPKKGAAE